MKHWLSRQCCSELIKFVNLNLTYVKLDRIWRNFIFKTDDSIHFCRRKLSYKIVAPFMGNWGMCVNFFICNFLGRNEQALWMVRYGAPSNEFSTTSRESRFLSFLFSFQVNNSQNCLNLCRTWCKNSKIYHLKAKKLDFTAQTKEPHKLLTAEAICWVSKVSARLRLCGPADKQRKHRVYELSKSGYT